MADIRSWAKSFSGTELKLDDCVKRSLDLFVNRLLMACPKPVWLIMLCTFSPMEPMRANFIRLGESGCCKAGYTLSLVAPRLGP